MPPTMTNHRLASGHLIKDEQFGASAIHNVQIYIEKKMVGRALLIKPLDCDLFVLLDIVVYNDSDRRKGLGDEMMKHLTENYSPIVTSYLSDAGRDLCLKHNFVLTEKTHRKGLDILSYVKGVVDNEPV